MLSVICICITLRMIYLKHILYQLAKNSPVPKEPHSVLSAKPRTLYNRVNLGYTPTASLSAGPRVGHDVFLIGCSYMLYIYIIYLHIVALEPIYIYTKSSGMHCGHLRTLYVICASGSSFPFFPIYTSSA